MNSLNSKKSSDIYGMSATFLKTLSLSVSETLSTVYNKSLSQGIFPDHMKHAMVTPVYKGGSKLDMKNRRPIVCIGVSTPLKNSTPPPWNQQTVQAHPLFRQSPLYIGFS